MPKKKKYTFYQCKDCEIDFLVPEGIRKKASCPKCADLLFTEKIRDIWLEKPILYKRPWSEEEDQFLLDGIKAGYTHREISEGLKGRTKKAVTRRLSQLKKRAKT